MADDDDSTTNDDPNNPVCQPGMEHGIYTWNPTTDTFFANPTITDTNGECGFSTGDGLGSTAIITISGDTWTMDLGDHGGKHQGTRLVPDAAKPIVGTWYGSDPENPVFYLFTFFADGTYIIADSDDSTTNTDPNNPICQPGMEHGTYTWDPSTGVFSANPILTDTNGECGFSTGDGLGSTAIITISGDTLTMDLGDHGGARQVTRLVP